MSLDAVVKAGISGVLCLPAVQKIAGDATAKVGKILWHHFKDSSHVLAEAFQDSYGCAMAAIAAGLAPEHFSEPFWKTLSAKFKKTIASKVSREFSSQLQEHYLLPFAQQASLNNDDLLAFQQNTYALCQQLLKQRKEILPLTELKENDWATLVHDTFAGDVSAILVEQIQNQQPCDDQIAAFLRCRNLLGDAVLFFFREMLRKNDRVEKTLAELQREGLWLDLRDLKAAQTQMQETLQEQLARIESQLGEKQNAVMTAMQQGNFAALGEFAPQLQSLQQESQQRKEHLERIPSILQEAQQAWSNFGERMELFEQRFGYWCEAIAEQVELVFDKVGEIDVKLEEIHQDTKETANKVTQILQEIAALQEMMRQMQLSPQIQPRDEFTQHNSRNLELIHRAENALARIPRSSNTYATAAITVSSALSSAGNLDKAIALLLQASAAAKNQQEKALASYNLFQLYLRQQKNKEALESLSVALDIDPTRYALHNSLKYGKLLLRL